MQLVPPQKPPTQGCPAQHWLDAVQEAPYGVHWTPPQKPPAQSSAQQSVVSVQAFPSGWHRLVRAHTPPGPQASPWQQSAAATQLWPAAPQAPGPMPSPP